MKKIYRSDSTVTTYGETKPKMVRKKQDPKLVSKQRHEVTYVAGRFGVSRNIVKSVIKKVGISRKKVYAELRLLGYEILKPKKLKK